MNQNQFLVGSVVLATVMFAGCQKNTRESAAGEGSVEIGPKYSAKNGLFVPSETRLSLGLKIVEVTEQTMPAVIDVQLRVHQAGKESILATASVTPQEASQMASGLAVHAQASGTNFAGRVLRMNDELQKATGMIEMLVELRNPNGSLSVGAFLSARIDLASTAAVVTIPRAALLECSDGHSVYTVNGENFFRTPVKAGAMSSDFVEIKDGLYAGDQVVLQPVMSLWMTELAAVKGGQACCAVPAKGK